jgi:hypothetical protein
LEAGLDKDTIEWWRTVKVASTPAALYCKQCGDLVTRKSGLRQRIDWIKLERQTNRDEVVESGRAGCIVPMLDRSRGAPETAREAAATAFSALLDQGGDRRRKVRPVERLGDRRRSCKQPAHELGPFTTEDDFVIQSTPVAFVLSLRAAEPDQAPRTMPRRRAHVQTLSLARATRTVIFESDLMERAYDDDVEAPEERSHDCVFPSPLPVVADRAPRTIRPNQAHRR